MSDNAKGVQHTARDGATNSRLVGHANKECAAATINIHFVRSPAGHYQAMANPADDGLKNSRAHIDQL